jgi:aquaporin NIP
MTKKNSRTNLMQRVMAEFIGTFTVVFFACGSIMVADRFPGTIPTYGIPPIFGMVIATMIYTLGHVSGAHFNPAVTLAFAVAKHFPARQVAPYCLAQFMGSLAAALLVSAILPAGDLYGATVPTVAPHIAFIWEVILSFFMMFVITAVATDTRAVGMMAGIAIGTVVALCAFIGGPITGASMNPARSFGPALFQSTIDSFWIYLLAPVIGAIFGALTYRLIRERVAH